MKTAVEWLYNELSKNNTSTDSVIERINKESSIWKQAKAMERDLIKESCTMAIMQWHEWDKTNYLDKYDHKIEGAEIWAEEYVKELYGEIEVPKPNQNK